MSPIEDPRQHSAISCSETQVPSRQLKIVGVLRADRVRERDDRLLVDIARERRPHVVRGLVDSAVVVDDLPVDGVSELGVH